jgi:hypothetical protein
MSEQQYYGAAANFDSAFKRAKPTLSLNSKPEQAPPNANTRNYASNTVSVAQKQK